ncbi:forkhead transcription factor Fkh1/2 [Trichophyton equinum CBS 127.97]|uniref:Forkhead transcription factor Fkh1/2 n=1 Tax=Trichophyton equinum (strain ATCC MYA-4606 / CBS 127.97) TaxID=559882 RepID=F2PJD6_TRIEC|nr:forkhead transcription factor Fkh1/2 [Trichophyton equinum CBS 127.97]
MAPSVAKRRSRRREVDLHEDPVDMDALDSSPTRRSVKKRKVEHTSQPDFERTVEPAASADENDDEHDNEMAANQDLVDSVIANLAVAREPIAVMTLHSNARTQQENKESVEAYAKIAGRDWTYYVKTLHVNIGRPPDRDQRLDAQSSPITVAAQALPDVHIDLGPGKFVSRLHAEIYYDRDDPPCWRVRVNGRNGVRVNNTFYKRGTATQISCGDILEIANTQMMFVTPRDKAVIDPAFIQQAQNGVHTTRETDETAWDGSYHSHPITANAGTSSSAGASTGGPRRMSFALNGGREPADTASVSAAAANSTGGAATANGSRRAAEIANAATVTPKRQTTPSQRPLSRDTIEPSSKVSPMYNRGLMMESTEEIDYSEDAAKDIKPPFSYANMIAQAIFSTEEEKLSLSNIYKFIMQKYAFYRHSQSGWQNSIRHNLSLNKAFQKVPRRTDEPGKGMKWQIVPEHREEYWKKQAKRSGQSSTPASPIGKERAGNSAYQPINGHVATNVEKNIDASAAALAARPSPQANTTASPGYHSFSVAPIEAYTPDRGSRNGLGINGAGTHDFDEQSPLPNGPRNNAPTRPYGLSDNAVASPPVLSSSYYDDAASSMITPAPLRQQPRLAPPSTAQVPSRYMQLSSPAQFWKLADMGNTPARPMPDISPLKPSIGTSESNRWKTLNPIPSSSPLPANLGSPTKPPTSSLRSRGGVSPLGRDVRERESSTIKRHQNSWDEDDDDNDGDDTGFDLARGFQPIGSFHRQINNAARAS